jgi:glutamine synthetase
VVFWDDGADGGGGGGGKGARTPLYDRFIAGVLATMHDFTLLYAPNVNSYKRFAAGSFAPTAIAWGLDNRTCAVRLVGHGKSARMENRLPGGDVNPYLALAAMLAGGLYGIEHELDLEDELVGNAYTSDKEHVPHTLHAARDAFHGSAVARTAFGDEVVDHYTNMADVELAAYGAAVTDWELRRGFERL